MCSSDLQHLIPEQLTLAMRVRRLVTRDGATVADVVSAFDRVNQPDRAQRLRYASDLFAMLAGEIAVVMAQRRRDEEAAQRRADEERQRTEAAPPDQVRAALASLFKTPTD